MDELEKKPETDLELPEFTLEDILKEFGSGEPEPAAAPAVLADAPPAAPSAEAPSEPDLLVWTPKAEPAPKPAVVSGDTVVLDTAGIRAAAAKAAAPAVTGDTVRFEPVTTTGAVAVAPAEPVPENAEPFKPDFDAPVDEYVPPEPIVFRPRSRLSELRRKLIAGPEKRYHALAESGLGKLQIGIFLSMLVVVLSVVSIILYRLGLVRENRMRLLVFGELFAMLFSALLGSERLLEGITGLFKGKLGPDTLLAVSFLACIADGVFCLRQVRVPFCAAFCLQVTMALWAEYQRRSAEMAQMDTLRKATRLNRIAKAPDCYEGRAGFCVCDGQVEDFMDTYQLPTTPEKVISRYVIAALVISAAAGIYAGITTGLAGGIQTWSAAILAGAPVTMFICQSRPLAILQRRLHRFGSVICGWQGAKAAVGAAAIPLRDSDLFPGGSVKINGVKFYSRRNTDQVISYATAVMEAAENGLTPLFTHMRQSRGGEAFGVEELHVYDGAGLGAMVCGENVLVGTQKFLKDMGVELPTGTRVNQAVYVAVEGEFCAVFALAFGKLKGVSAGLAALGGCRNLTPVLASDNFLVNESFIHSRFGVNTRRFAFPERAERLRLAAWAPEEENQAICALTTQEGLAGAAFAITGARSLRTACILGAAIHIIGGVLGLGIVTVLTVLGRTELLIPTNLLLFELCWTVPGLLISEWTRNP